jgi:hypothetical protein
LAEVNGSGFHDNIKALAMKHAQTAKRVMNPTIMSENTTTEPRKYAQPAVPASP